MMETVSLPCEYCGQRRELPAESLEAKGVFRVFCNDRDCEDLAIWNDGVPKLSKRQAEIARLIAEGLSSPEMGRTLGLSADTIRQHTLRLFRVLSVHSKAAAVHKLWQLGFFGESQNDISPQDLRSRP